MKPNTLLRDSVRSFYAWIGAMAGLVAGLLLAERLVMSASPAVRAAAAAIGVGAWIPWLVVVARQIRRSDEFTRRIHLVSLAIAFGGALGLVALLDWLVRAGFVARPDLRLVTLAFLLLWLGAWLAVRRHFERAA